MIFLLKFKKEKQGSTVNVIKKAQKLVIHHTTLNKHLPLDI